MEEARKFRKLSPQEQEDADAIQCQECGVSSINSPLKQCNDCIAPDIFCEYCKELNECNICKTEVCDLCAISHNCSYMLGQPDQSHIACPVPSDELEQATPTEKNTSQAPDLAENVCKKRRIWASGILGGNETARQPRKRTWARGIIKPKTDNTPIEYIPKRRRITTKTKPEAIPASTVPMTTESDSSANQCNEQIVTLEKSNTNVTATQADFIENKRKIALERLSARSTPPSWLLDDHRETYEGTCHICEKDIRTACTTQLDAYPDCQWKFCNDVACRDIGYSKWASMITKTTIPETTIIDEYECNWSGLTFNASDEEPKTSGAPLPDVELFCDTYDEESNKPTNEDGVKASTGTCDINKFYRRVPWFETPTMQSHTVTVPTETITEDLPTLHDTREASQSIGPTLEKPSSLTMEQNNLIEVNRTKALQRKRLLELSNGTTNNYKENIINEPKMRRTQHMDEPDIDDCIKDFIDQQTPPQSPDDEVPEENKEHIINEETKPINKRPNKKELQQESAKKSKLAKIRTAAEWTEHITSSSNRPPSGSVTSVQVGGKGPANVHSTHDAWLVNNITFCRACGYYMELKSTSLREECIRAPPNGQY